MNVEKPDRPNTKTASALGTFLALVAMLVILGGCFFTFALVFAGGLLDKRVLSVGALLLFGTVGQYYLWGRWLERRLKDKPSNEPTDQP
jgi:hypothetical protein